MSDLKLLAQGAEAKIFLEKKENLIVKDRISKLYRIPEIDNAIRKRRTRAEIKLLQKASHIINVPKPKEDDAESKIVMPFIEGQKLSEIIDSLPLNEQKQIMGKIGKNIALLHKNDIIHGDLTTSNMILRKKDLFFIDFGLGYFSQKIEDKAVDLHLLRQALESRHFKNWEKLLEEVIKSYEKEIGKEQTKKILERIVAIEKRGRYRH